MSKQSEQEVDHVISMMRHYADRLTTHASNKGTLTTDQVASLTALAEQIGEISEPAADSKRQKPAGSNPPNASGGK